MTDGRETGQSSPNGGIGRRDARASQPQRKFNLDAVLPSQGGATFGVGGFKENTPRNFGAEDDFEDDFEMMLGMEQELAGGLMEDEEMELMEGPEDDMVPLGVDDVGMAMEDRAEGHVGDRAEDCRGEAGAGSLEDKIVGVATSTVAAAKQQEDQHQRTSCLTNNVIPDRVPLLPQRDALHATEHYMTVTAADGNERVYAPIHRAPSMDAGTLAQALRRSKGSLLATKIDALLGMVERDQFERVLAETKAAKRRAKIEKRRMEQMEGVTGDVVDAASESKLATQLWVEKYAPTGFLDLLSDELISREVVKWLKSWDCCVFGGCGAAGDAASTTSASSKTDPLGRPEHKIILLAGPPGLGKTTLAHIVAKHCGYKPMEINASDERNGPALMSKVVGAMEMRSVTTDKRPNCIIIDEIDGASGGGEGRSAIGALVKLAQAKVTPKNKESAKDKEVPVGGSRQLPPRTSQTQKEKLKPLTRPVICICNDLYAPVLRPLRDIARVFVVKPPRPEKLVERLQTICRKERLKADKSTLRGLIEKTECDIRSCLNTMQFIAKKQKTMKLSDIASVGAGQKDISVGVFRLWKELLHLRQGPSIIGKVVETESQRCLRRYNTLSDFGDQDLVLSGIYESLPSIILFDMALMKTSTVLENIQMVDCIQKRVSRHQDFSLMKYLPACTLRVASVLAGPENPTVRWPRMLQSSRKDMADRSTMMHKWRLGMKPETYASVGKVAAMLDVVPFLPWLTAPALRPVSRHLYSTEERKNLEKVVDVMLSLGFEFSLEDEDDLPSVVGSSGDGQPPVVQRTNIEYSPPLHLMWEFSQAEFTNVETQVKPREVPMPTRQMVLHELGMERIKRNAKAQQEKRGSLDHGRVGISTATPSSQTPSKTFAGVVPTTLAQRLEENKRNAVGSQKSNPSKPVRKRNWLEKLKDKESKRETTFTCTQGGTKKKARAEDMAVLYKFHEGYTNAVRKPVRINDL